MKKFNNVYKTIKANVKDKCLTIFKTKTSTNLKVNFDIIFTNIDDNIWMNVWDGLWNKKLRKKPKKCDLEFAWKLIID
jgi:hypothetical protein